jgi:hypothetical protein
VAKRKGRLKLDPKCKDVISFAKSLSQVSDHLPKDLLRKETEKFRNQHLMVCQQCAAHNERLRSLKFNMTPELWNRLNTYINDPKNYRPH